MVPHSSLKETLKRDTCEWQAIFEDYNVRVCVIGKQYLHQAKSLYNAQYSKGIRCLLYYSLLFSYRYLTLNSNNYRYLLSKETPINHLLFMDYLKLYGKTQRELQPSVHTVQIISKDIGLEFGMDKCSTARLKKRKICDTEYRNARWTTNETS